MKFIAASLGAMLCIVALAAPAAEPCAFKWDLSREVALFTQPPVKVTAGADSQSAPHIEAGQFYEAMLQPQSATKLAVPPSKRMLDDGAFAGLFRLRMEVAGPYRVSIDSGFWLDAIAEGKALAALDFNGSPTCPGPRKVVVYELPAGGDVLLQFTAAGGERARFSVTRVNPTPP